MKIQDGVVVRIKQSLFSPVFSYWGCIELTCMYPKHTPSPMREALLGKRVNDSVTCASDIGQSFYDESLIIETRLSNLNCDKPLKPGMMFVAQFNGRELRGTIKTMNGDTVTIDCNHPLVGAKQLTITNYILEIRNPTEKDRLELAQSPSPKISIF